MRVLTHLCSLLVSILLASPALATLSVSSSAPSNVFIAGDDVRLQVEGAPAETPLTVSAHDYEGEAVAASLAVGNDIHLGRLPRGYYEVTITAGADSFTASLVVVPQPVLRKEPALAVDAAHSWLIQPSQFVQGAELLRRAGRSWARERLSWPEVEPQRGVFKWGKYDPSANAEHSHGISIDQIFHQSPAWSNAGHSLNRFPDDLRDAYHFGEAAARHFKGRVQSWEIWNEADISGFSVDPGSEYAAFLKAAYLGFKAGDPQVKIALVSLAIPSGRYEDSLFRNGVAGYYDIYNYHIYADPSEYPARAKGHFALLDRYHAPKTPVWITESGIALHAVNNTLSPEDKRRQAEFIPKSCVMSLASGTDRYFFFVFPHYLENGVEFGLLDSSLMPYPGYAAIAAASDLLGQARYRGEVAAGPGAHAYLFDNGHSDTLVVWSDNDSKTHTFSLPSIHFFNCVGAPLPVPLAGSLALTPSPIYILLPHGKLKSTMPGRLERTQTGPRAPARSLILRIRPPDSTFHKDQEVYQFRAGEKTALQVEVYNFGAGPRQGIVNFRLPTGWKAESSSLSVQLQPLDRQMASVTITPPTDATPDNDEIEASFNDVPPAGSTGRYQSSKDTDSTPVVLDVTLDPATLQPSRRDSMNFNNSRNWQDNISANGVMTHGGAADGSLEFDINFQREGDRWAYPTIPFNPPADWRRFGALAFDYNIQADDPDTRLRVILGETNASAYVTGTGYGIRKEWQHIIIPFTAFTSGSFAPADPDGKLDLDQISVLRVGCNTKGQHVTLRLKNVELVGYGK